MVAWKEAGASTWMRLRFSLHADFVAIMFTLLEAKYQPLETTLSLEDQLGILVQRFHGMFLRGARSTVNLPEVHAGEPPEDQILKPMCTCRPWCGDPSDGEPRSAVCFMALLIFLQVLTWMKSWRTPLACALASREGYTARRRRRIDRLGRGDIFVHIILYCTASSLVFPNE